MRLVAFRKRLEKIQKERKLPMKCIGIIGAMEAEVRGLKEKMTEVTITRKASMEFNEGIIAGKKVVVVRRQSGGLHDLRRQP